MRVIGNDEQGQDIVEEERVYEVIIAADFTFKVAVTATNKDRAVATAKSCFATWGDARFISHCDNFRIKDIYVREL